MAKFRDSVRKSLMDYRDARAKRREVLGPDLIDTVGDISVATGEAIKDTAETVALNAMYGYDAVKDAAQRGRDAVVNKAQDLAEGFQNRYESARDGFKSVVTNLRDKVDNLQEKASGFWNNFKDKMKSARDNIADKFTRGSERVGLAKQKTVEDVQNRMDGFRMGLADRLSHVADVLRGDANASDIKPAVESKVEETPKVEPKEPTVEEIPKVEPKEPKVEEIPKVEPKEPKVEETPKVEPKEPKVEETPKVEPKEPKVEETPKVEPKEPKAEETPKVEPKEPKAEETGIDDPTKKQVKVADIEDAPQEVQGLPADMKDDFLRYYLQRQESVRKTFEHLDRQQRPPAKLKDYMIESGFAAFMEEIRGQTPELPERTLNQDGGGELTELAHTADKVLELQEELMRNKMNQKEEFEDTTQGHKKSTKVEKDVDGDKKTKKPEKEPKEHKKTFVDEVKEAVVPELTKEELEELQEHAQTEQLKVDTSKKFEKETESPTYGSQTTAYGPQPYHDGVEWIPYEEEPEEITLTEDDLSEFLNREDMQL